MTVTTSTLPALANKINKFTLAVAEPLITLAKFGRSEKLPQRNSLTMTFSRFENMAPTDGYGLASTKLLAEGVIPSEVNPTRTTINISVGQYGNVSRLSDVAGWVNEVDVKEEYVQANARQMARTTELVYYAGITSGTNVFRLTDDIGGVSGAARVNVAGRMNAVAIQKAIRNLRSNEAEPITRQINASDKIGTQAIRESYVCIIDPKVEFDVTNIPGFIPVTSYSQQGGVYPGECGAYRNVRFIVSSLATKYADVGAAVAGTYSTTGTSNDVFVCMVFGKDAFVTMELEGSTESIYIDTKDHLNPTGQWCTFGWKSSIGSGILNDNWLLRIECAATA